MSNSEQGAPAPEKPKDEKAYLWKYACIIALVYGAIQTGYIIYQVVDKSTKTGPDFTADIEYYEWSLPPMMAGNIAHARSGIDGVFDDLGKKPDRTSPLFHHSTAVRESLKVLKPFESANGYCKVSLRNNGPSAAKDARIQLKDSGFAVVNWDDGKTQDLSFTNDIPLGLIPIAKELSVSIWTKSKKPASTPLLVHESGSIPILSRQPAEGRNSRYLIWFLAGSVVASLTMVIRLSMAMRNASRHVDVLTESMLKLDAQVRSALERSP